MNCGTFQAVTGIPELWSVVSCIVCDALCSLGEEVNSIRQDK